MKEIPYTSDPHDVVGSRCDVLSSSGLKCQRRLGHPPDTKTIYKYDDDEGEEIVEFNHRARAGGRFFTW